MAIFLLQLNFDFVTKLRNENQVTQGHSAIAMGTKLTDITKQLDMFLSSSSGSILLKETNGISGLSIIEAQVQKRWLDTDKSGTTRLRDTSSIDVICLNIVNVVVAEKNRRKGLFTDFLELLEGFDYGSYFDKCKLFYIRIDKVMNPILDVFLSKRRYTGIITGNESHYSYHKIVRNLNDVGNKLVQQPEAEHEFTSNHGFWTEDGNCDEALTSNSSPA
jgi:hypothetical protein